MGARQFEAGDWQSTIHATRANDDLVRLKSQPALGFDSVRVEETCGTGLFVDGHPKVIHLAAQRTMRVHFVDDFANTRKETSIIQDRLAYLHTILSQLTRFAHQSASVSQCPDRNRPVIGRHATECAIRYQCRLRTKIGCTQSSEHACRSSADNGDLRHSVLLSAFLLFILPRARGMRAATRGAPTRRGALRRARRSARHRDRGSG